MRRVPFFPIAIAAVAAVVAVTAPPSGHAVEGAGAQPDAASARSAREVRGHTPYLAIENDPPPKLIVDEALRAEGDGRVGGCQPRGLPRTGQDGEVHGP